MKRPAGFDSPFAAEQTQDGLESAAISAIKAQPAVSEAVVSEPVTPDGGESLLARRLAQMDTQQLFQEKRLRLEEEVLQERADAEQQAAAVDQLNADLLPAAQLPVADALGARSDQYSDLGVRVKRALRLEKMQKRRLWQARKQLQFAKKERKRAMHRFYRSLSVAARRRLRNALLAVGAVTVFSALVLVAAFSPIMSVRQIQVTGSISDAQSAQIAEALKPLSGDALAMVSEREIFRLLQPLTYIEKYTFSRIPPDQLVVQVVGRKPVLVLQRGERFSLVDAAGVELSHGDKAPEGFPVAVDSNAADTASKAFLAVAGVLRDLPPEVFAQVAKVRATTEQDIEFEMRSGFLLRWGGAEDTALKVVLLARMQHALAEQHFKVIDVSSVNAPVFQ